ncbi:MAG TPA: serine hydrolase [Steroidobacteraceae bacterium]|nr:serine hydrolase [Steroidobacteraceae bacterium]
MEKTLNGKPTGAAASEAELIRRTYEGRLLPDVQVDTFRNTHLMFATRTVRRAGPVQALEHAPADLIDELSIESKGAEYDFYDYLSRNRVAGLLILKRGKIALERYDLGYCADAGWLSMSMAKSVSTTLIGAAIQDGLLRSVEEPLTAYLPQLKGSGLDGVSIRHLLQMTSGLRWNDTHTDPTSERRRMLELQIEQRPGAILSYVAGQPKVAPPGTLWNYSTGETHVVGALLRALTGRWVADYLSEKIWSKLGMEADATWWLEAPGGLEVAGSGISATLRDYGRFGLFMQNDGVIGTERVLPPGWVRESGAPREVGGKRVDYGYMWWPVAGRDGAFTAGAFSARGIFGQFIYINPREQVVIVVLSSRSKPKGAEAITDNDFFNAVVEALHQEETT